MGIVRSTFVIDEEGNLAEVHGKVKVKGHVEGLLRGSRREGGARSRCEVFPYECPRPATGQ